MLRHALTAAFLFGVATTAPSPAKARGTCADRDFIVSGLDAKFGESHIGGGLQSETQMVEIWMSHSTGSFTILLTSADGQSCIVSSGKNWTSIEPHPFRAGKPS